MSNHEAMSNMELSNHIGTKTHKVKGAFFKVHTRTGILTKWGRTKKELADYLNKQRINFLDISPLH